jgi:nitrogen regulatory protein PII
LLTAIVERGQGSKLLATARSHGISGGTIALGQGTIGIRQTGRIGISAESKDIILLIANTEAADQAIERFSQSRQLNHPRRGIAMIVEVSQMLGSAYCRMDPGQTPQGGLNMMKQAIVVIVDRGQAETVVEAAERAGALGATVVNGRGAGVHETSKLFAMAVEPEKEIVLLVVDLPLADRVLGAIRKDCELDEPGRGFAFAVDLQKFYSHNEG